MSNFLLKTEHFAQTVHFSVKSRLKSECPVRGYLFVAFDTRPAIARQGLPFANG